VCETKLLGDTTRQIRTPKQQLTVVLIAVIALFGPLNDSVAADRRRSFASSSASRTSTSTPEIGLGRIAVYKRVVVYFLIAVILDFEESRSFFATNSVTWSKQELKSDTA
jgi:hypothetical protein